MLKMFAQYVYCRVCFLFIKFSSHYIIDTNPLTNNGLKILFSYMWLFKNSLASFLPQHTGSFNFHEIESHFFLL